MRPFDLEITQNDFRTKKDIDKYLDDLFKPLDQAFIRHSTRLHIANTGSGAADSVSGVEGFSRIIWGLAAQSEKGPEDIMWQRIRQGLIHGTDPKDPDYFGLPTDYDQRIVEMAAIGYALVLRPVCLYDPLTDGQKLNLYNWLDRINHVEAHDCNWKFFRVMVNIGFKSLKLPYNKEKMTAYLEDMDAYYVGNGWYTDGMPGEAHVDYYVPFAMHYYGLFYSMHMKDVDRERALIYEERAALFASEFIHWFARDGSALPYGRSLTYRYAQSAFWSILAASGLETEVSLGQMKGLILRNLRWWNDQAIYDSAGYLTVGYCYPNMFMAEDYNAPGSVYWSLKSMLIASLSEDHPFWQTEEADLPKMAETKIVEPARMVICRQSYSDQIIAYNGGNFHTNGHIHVESKYEKFAYSSVFGFSTPRSYRTLAFGAYDSTLAVSKDGTYYRHKDRSSCIRVSEKWIYTCWHPYEDVKIETYLIAGLPWHLRLHRIESPHKLALAEGGFALGLGERGQVRMETMKNIEGENGIGIGNGHYSGILDLTNNQHFEAVIPASNTNIMTSRTLIPTLKSKVNPGTHWIGALVFADRNGYKAPDVPKLLFAEDEIAIIFQEMGETYKLYMSDKEIYVDQGR